MNSRILFIFLLFAPYAFAQPVKSPDCAEKINVRPARNGSGVFFDETCSTAYVLPPAAGTMELSGLEASASPEDCRELADLEKSRAQLSARLRELTKRKSSENEGGSTIGRGGGTIGGGGRSSAPQEDLGKIAEETDAIIKEIEKLREAGKVFSQTEGMTAKVTYTLDHEGLVAEYQNLNPHIKSFARVQPEVAYLSFSEKGDKLREEQSEVLDYTVPGIVKMPGDDQESEAPKNTVYFGTALSGKIRFTVKGACRFMNSAGKVPDRLRPSQIEKHLSSNITYAYALTVRRKYYARYDFKALFERLETKTKQGGFLSSKTLHEIVQRREAGGWFTFKSESDDTRFSNEVLVQQLKAEMIDRVMKQIAVAEVPGIMNLPTTTEPGPKGVDVAAEGFKKCPHAYCQVAGYVLDFIGATFGRSTAAARFLSTVGSSSEERVDEKKALRYIGTSTFKDYL